MGYLPRILLRFFTLRNTGPNWRPRQNKNLKNIKPKIKENYPAIIWGPIWGRGPRRTPETVKRRRANTSAEGRTSTGTLPVAQAQLGFASLRLISKVVGV